MEKYEVIITEPAEKDLNDIADYIAFTLQNISAALKLVSDIKEAILSLANAPMRFEVTRDERLAMLGIRKIIISNYLIFYTVSNANVSIIRILYCKRDWLNII